METEPSMQATRPRKRGAHLTLDERGAIQFMRSQGMSLRQIALQIGCAPTTIGKELDRGTPKKTGTRGPAPAYRAKLGQQTYRDNRLRCRKSPAVAQCGSFLVWMRKRIKRCKWSFDVCVGYARRHDLFPGERIPCAKTLYNALRAGRLRVSPFDLAVYLKRRQRGRGKVRERKRQHGRSIEERPAHIAPGGEFGHWEIDTVVGRRAGGGAAVLTLVEKRTRYFMALPLARRSAAAVEQALSGLYEEYGSCFGEVFKSVTSDNGTEFSELSRLEAWGASVYFAHPYSSCERGQNERHNGLLRRFIPKGTALEPYTADDLFWIADEINRLPRRCLDYRTPDELFEEQLDKVYTIQNDKHSTTNCSRCNCNWGDFFIHIFGGPEICIKVCRIGNCVSIVFAVPVCTQKTPRSL